MNRIEGFKLFCGLTQIAGLMVQIAAMQTIPAVLALMGFAAVAVWALTPGRNTFAEKYLYPFAAVCGVLLMAFALAR